MSSDHGDFDGRIHVRKLTIVSALMCRVGHIKRGLCHLVMCPLTTTSPLQASLLAEEPSSVAATTGELPTISATSLPTTLEHKAGC